MGWCAPTTCHRERVLMFQGYEVTIFRHDFAIAIRLQRRFDAQCLWGLSWPPVQHLGPACCRLACRATVMPLLLALNSMQ